MSSVSFVARFSLGMLLLAGCHDGPGSFDKASVEDASARQQLILTLAHNLQFYHSSDEEAAQPDWKDGRIYSISSGPGRKYKLYHGRMALRAELNRMLDSLQATGMVQIGDAQNGTDTVLSRSLARPLPAATVESTPIHTSTSTSTTWVEGDSTATVRTRTTTAGSFTKP